MGVKDLWSIISPIGCLIKLEDVEDKCIAIDLSCWVCDSQTANIGHTVVQPYLRNIFFRTICLLNSSILPIFVIEGKAPEIKLDTIQNRLLKQNSSKIHKKTNHSGARTRLKGHLNQCVRLLNLMGLPCLQAEGEAEATCAALYYHKIVDGVITQDSDVFLYGSQTVYRNFSGNQNKATVEKFKMEKIIDLLELDREGMICLALLLGCDYNPGGVPGVGKENALKLIRAWRAEGICNPIERIINWRCREDPIETTQIQSRKLKKSDRPIEEKIREKALKTEGFPFSSVIKEFLTVIDKPCIKTRWEMPRVPELVKWCKEVLCWELDYAVAKVLPLATRWIVSCSMPQDVYYLKPVNIVRKRVLHRIPSYEIQWRVEESYMKHFNAEISSEFVNVESSELVQRTFSSLATQYEESLENKKAKGKKPRETKKKATSKEEKKKEEKVKKNKEEEKNKNENIWSDSFALDESVDEAELSRVIDGIVGLRVNEMNSVIKTNELNSNEYLREIEKNISLIELSSDSESNDEPSSENNLRKSKSLEKNGSKFYRILTTRNTNTDYFESLKLPYDSNKHLNDEECVCELGKTTFTDSNSSPLYHSLQKCDANILVNTSSSECSKDLFDSSDLEGDPQDSPFPRRVESLKLTSDYNSSVPCFNLLDSLSDLSFGSTMNVIKNCFAKEEPVLEACSVKKFEFPNSISLEESVSPYEGSLKLQFSSGFAEGKNRVSTPLSKTTTSEEFFDFDSPVVETLSLADRLKKKFEGKLDQVIDDF